MWHGYSRDQLRQKSLMPWWSDKLMIDDTGSYLHIEPSSFFLKGKPGWTQKLLQRMGRCCCCILNRVVWNNITSWFKIRLSTGSERFRNHLFSQHGFREKKPPWSQSSRQGNCQQPVPKSAVQADTSTPGNAFRHAHIPSWYSPYWQNWIECYKKLLQKQPAANASGSKATES